MWLCALKIAVVILALDPSGLVAFQLPKALASRAFEWLIGAALVFTLLRGGIASVPRHRSLYLVTGLLAASALSAVFAVDRYVAVFGDAENVQGLTFLFDMALLYLAIAIAVREERDAMLLIGAVVVSGAIATAYGAAQSLGLDPFAWVDDPRTRPFSTFGNPDHFGHFLSVFFGLALGLAMASRTRVLGSVGVVVTLLMSAVVATRATLLGFSGAVLALVSARRPSPRTLLIGIATTAAIVLGLATAPLGQRVLGGGSVFDRVELWKIALGATLSRPVLGHGPDNFRAAFASHRTVESISLLGAGPQATAHMWILDAASTTGIVGLLAVLAMVVFGTIELWRLATSRSLVGLPLFVAWCAYWVDGLVAASSLAAAWFPWVALGTAAGLRGVRASPVARPVNRWVGVLLAIVAMIAATTGARSFQANRDAWSAEDASHFGDADAALVFADRAAARDNGRADNWNRLGLALEAKQQHAASVEAYREATRRQPYEVVYRANLARGLARIAGTAPSARDAAIAAAREATAVDPNSPVGHVALAEIAALFGRCDIAREAATRAAALEAGHDELVRRAASCR